MMPDDFLIDGDGIPNVRLKQGFAEGADGLHVKSARSCASKGTD
jgi:hypothetical protein